MSGSASKTKNRICGCSVTPMSVFSIPAVPRSLVNPRPAMSYTRRDGVCTRRPPPLMGCVVAATAIGPAAVRRPDASSGLSDDTGVVPPGPRSSTSAHAARLRSGADDPSSATISHRRDAFVTSRSKVAVVAARPATDFVNRLEGAGGSSPISRRAPRHNRLVSVAPFASSRPCRVVELLTRVEVT